MHDRQTEAGPAMVLCARSPEKLVEHPGDKLRRDAFASVLDGELHRALSRRSPQDDRSTTVGVPQSIGHEVVEDMLDPLLVHQNQGQ